MNIFSISRLAFLTAAATASAGAWANKYQLIDLGSVAATSLAVNANGAVVADTYDPATETWQAQVYESGVWRQLPVNSKAYQINQAEDVVGLDEVTQQPMLWPADGDPVVIPLPAGGTSGRATGINDDQQVVGVFNQLACFSWTPSGGSVAFGTDGCEAYAVNNAGVATGQAGEGKRRNDGAFIWDGSTFTLLPKIEGAKGIARGLAINDHGDVVGLNYRRTTSGQVFAFLWNGALVDLDPARQFYSDVPLSINNAGEIVGYAGGSCRGCGRQPVFAARFADSKVIQLQTEVAHSKGWKLTVATSVNDSGVIVGYGNYQHALHGFMLIPQ